MNYFIFMTLRGAVQQLHYQQLRLGITTGAAAFNPLIQNSKMTARAHALTSKESYRSLTSVGCRPAIPPPRGEITGLCSSSGDSVHGRQMDIFKLYTKIHVRLVKIEPVGKAFLLKIKPENRLVCVWKWICCFTDGINAVKMWIMLNSPWHQVNKEVEVLSLY